MDILNVFFKWRIAILCSFLMLLHMAPGKSIGLLFVACLERYNADRKEVSFAFMLRFAVCNLSGAFAGFLGSKFGIKRVVMCGCVFASLSTAACFFAEDITFITIYCGIPLGFSIALIIHLIPALIRLHFETEQAVATGITFAGSCLGGFLFSPLIKSLLDTYGTSGTFLMLGALLLHSIPIAMLIVNPTNNQTPEKIILNLNSINESEISLSASSNNLELQCFQENCHSMQDNQKEYSASNPCIYSKMTMVDAKLTHTNSMTIIMSGKLSKTKVTTFLDEEHKTNVNYETIDNVYDTTSQDKEENKTSENINKSVQIPANIHYPVGYKKNIDILITETNKSLYFAKTYVNNSMDKWNTSKRVVNRNITDSEEVADILAEHSIKSFQQRGLNNSVTQNHKVVRQMLNKPPNTNPDQKMSESRSNWKLFSVLYDPLFLLVSFVTSSHMFILFAVSTAMVDFARDKGLSVDQGVYMLMCTTVADMVGRLGLGWVTDRGHVSVTNFAASCYFALALCYAAFAVATGFYVVMLCVALAGVFMGALMTVFPVMVSEYCTLEKNTMAMASRYIFLAPMALGISPLIGFFRETLGSYVWMFCFIDAVCILCCIVIVLIPLISRYRKKNKTKK